VRRRSSTRTEGAQFTTEAFTSVLLDVWRDGARSPALGEGTGHKLAGDGETPQVTELAALLVCVESSTFSAVSST
jgi:hypothetical protein